VSGMPYMRALPNASKVLALAFFTLYAKSAKCAQPQSASDTPFTRSDSCITVPAGQSASRSWKHGQNEHRDFVNASQARDAKVRAHQFSEFLDAYPSSDYRDIALLMEVSGEQEANEWDAAASHSRKLLRSSTIDNLALLIGGYTYLADALFHIRADGSSVFSKTAEVDWTVRCGRAAIEQLNSGSNRQEVQSVASSAAFTFAVSHAQACLLNKDEAGAFRESDMALRMKPADPRPNYLYALAMLRSQSPDYEVGIFYLARASSLSPGNDALKKSVEDLYRVYHGSGKGLDTLLKAAAANASPPANFKIEPQHTKNHYATKVAVGLSIAALLGYAMVKYPDATAQALLDIGKNGMPQSKGTSARIMVFGGEDHQTYLGCLSCPTGAEDSIYTPGGPHGSPASTDSIWNKATFGSPATTTWYHSVSHF